MLNARAKIIELLTINVEFKKAMKKRINQDAMRATMIVARAIRRLRILR
jgi:hypothetical protein